MKTQILFEAVSKFSSLCNEAIAQSEVAVDVRDITITPDGKMAALLVAESKSPASPGALHSVGLVQGSARTVGVKLEQMTGENPYARPIKMLVAGEEVGEGKKTSKSGAFVVVVGFYQP